MIGCRNIIGDKRGAALIEFALLAPLFIGFIFAVTQVGLVFYANTGLRHAVSEGARLAQLYPRPTNTQIIARVNERRFGLDPAFVIGPTITEGTQDGARFAEITMSYAASIDIFFFKVGPFRLTKTRRVYTQPPPPAA